MADVCNQVSFLYMQLAYTSACAFCLLVVLILRYGRFDQILLPAEVFDAETVVTKARATHIWYSASEHHSTVFAIR
jgi:hypothetical protein